jgi:hypothetical protein
MNESPVYVVPDRRGGWLVHAPESDEPAACASETEAEHVARDRARACGTRRIVVRDCYERVHELDVEPAGRR